VGSQGEGERSDEPDLEDLEIAPPSAPPLRVHLDGQYFRCYAKCIPLIDAPTLPLQMMYNRTRSRLCLLRPNQSSIV